MDSVLTNTFFKGQIRWGMQRFANPNEHWL